MHREKKSGDNAELHKICLKRLGGETGEIVYPDKEMLRAFSPEMVASVRKTLLLKSSV